MMYFAVQTASAVSAIILLIAYLTGVTLGMFGSIVYGSVREDHEMSLLEQAPDDLSGGARAFLGLYIRDYGGYLRSLPPGRRARGSSRGGNPPESAAPPKSAVRG
jgi:hypothetical protein